MGQVEDGKLCAILSYLLIGIIWFFADPKMQKNAFVKYHVKQGLVFLIVCIIISFIASMIWFLMWIAWALYILELFWLITGIINAANGEKKELWLIGQFAKNFTF